MKQIHGSAHGLPLKKKFGQHFLRDQHIIDNMINAVNLNSESSVFEIGCGDGFLTKSILQTNIARLWVFEIDPHWAKYVSDKYKDPRMCMHLDNILDIDFSCFDTNKPWLLLANLPYAITFPILHKLQTHRDILKEAIVMIQEEVAQKLVKTSGRGYGFPSLFFQHFFEIKLLSKIKPTAFYPPPKVDSRLIYLKPRENLLTIPNEKEFWIFIKRCFLSPRRTLKNNLQSYHYKIENINSELLSLRAQQMNMRQLIDLFTLINV